MSTPRFRPEDLIPGSRAREKGHGDGNGTLSTGHADDGVVVPESNFSGRTLVIGLVIAVLVIWAGIAALFQSWKAEQVRLASFGENQVAPAIDQLAPFVPPGVSDSDWKAAVADTHGMLIALTGSGLLDQGRMEELRRDIEARVLRVQATPSASLVELTGLWDDLDAKAGPVIAPDTIPPPPNSRHAKRHPRPARPKILPPAPKRDLPKMQPRG